MPKGFLKDIEVEEVSLVDAPANRTPFFFHKSMGQMMKDESLMPLMQKVMGSSLDEKSVAVLQKAYLSGDISIHSALGTLSVYLPDFPSELLDSIKTIVGALVVSWTQAAAENEKAEDESDMGKGTNASNVDQVRDLLKQYDENVSAYREKIKAFLPADVRKTEDEADRWKKLADAIANINSRLDGLTQKPAEAPAETPAETPTEAPAETPAETPAGSQGSTEVPAGESEEMGKVLKQLEAITERLSTLEKTARPRTGIEKTGREADGDDVGDDFPSIQLG